MKKKLAIILTVVGVLICFAVSLSFFLGPKSSERVMLYYNLDGYLYQNPNNTALSNRKPDGKGVYKIDFVADGAKVTYTTTNAELVNYIDFLQVMTMEVTEEGEIQSVAAPNKPVSNRDTIQQIEKDQLILNTSFAYNGRQITLPLAEDCRFYDVANDGAFTEPEVMDEVLAYSNEQGDICDVFILRRTPRTKLYWRLDRKYDSRARATTRQPDANGVYTVPFAVEGQQLELQCKDPTLVDAMDAPAANEAFMGLVLDEQGLVTQVLPAYRGLRGRQLCTQYDVVAIEDGRFSVMNKLGISAQVMNVALSDDCLIYDISAGATQVGEQTDVLQLGDRVTVFSDSMGNATHILVHMRLLESPVYFNLTPMYGAGKTMRQPDESGFYSFQMVSDEGLLTLKTKEQSIANQVDGYQSRGMGLVLDGDVILRAFDVSCATGGDVLAAGRHVTSFNDGMIISGNPYGGGLSSILLHPECKFIDATNSPSSGDRTKLQQGARFYAFGNADGQATYVFITRHGF